MNQTERSISTGAGLPWSQLIAFLMAAGVAIWGLVAGLDSLFQPNGVLAVVWLAVVSLAAWVMFAQARRA